MIKKTKIWDHYLQKQKNKRIEKMLSKLRKWIIFYINHGRTTWHLSLRPINLVKNTKNNYF